jgi:hypothetical protein
MASKSEFSSWRNSAHETGGSSSSLLPPRTLEFEAAMLEYCKRKFETEKYIWKIKTSPLTHQILTRSQRL